MAEAHLSSRSAEPPGMPEWRRLAEKALDGRDFSTLQSRTRDGILVEPLYEPRADRLPIVGRGAWAILQLVDDPDPERANRQAVADLEGGVDGLALRFAAEDAAPGGLPADEHALRLALDGVDLTKVRLRLEPHPGALATAAWLRELVAGQGIAPELTRISWGLDPVAVSLADSGSGADAAVSLAGGFGELRAARFGGALAELDGRVVHEAGGSEAQELASVLAAAAWWLRVLAENGVSAEAALPHFGASLAVDRDQFVSIAKLRAMRLLWARLAELCGAPGVPLSIHAETSRRMLTRADPHTNLVRTTIAAVAAALAGADTISVVPFDAARGLPTASARALARNMQHLLSEESHLHRVADPGAGSGLIECLTDALAETAWSEFQQLEREGGILESLAAGALQARIAEKREALAAEVASGSAPLVGVTVFQCPEDSGRPGTKPVATKASFGGLAPVSLEDLAQGTA